MDREDILNLVTHYKAGGNMKKWSEDNGHSYQTTMQVISRLRKLGVDLPYRKKQYDLKDIAKELKGYE